mmetsp:Transcript_16793/g.22985  ORF Transcript_16793/g.22985 Transcript_16793/m.22985 type:complete len:298 (-) Transcript_16793:43-936(-)
MKMLGRSFDQNEATMGASVLRMSKVPIENHPLTSQPPMKQQRQKHVSFAEVDNKSLVTESTISISSQSEATSFTSHDKEVKRFQHDQNMHGENVDSQAKLRKIKDLQRSNRSLQVENMTMKKSMREMKAKMDSMEESLQRNQPQKEKELLEIIESLNKLTTKQGKKLAANKNTKKKLKTKITERDKQISHLKKEKDKLKSNCAKAEKEFLLMHDEVTCLQEELVCSLDRADKLESKNRDLEATIKKLKAEKRSGKQIPSYNSARSMSTASLSCSASKKMTEESQVKIKQLCKMSERR